MAKKLILIAAIVIGALMFGGVHPRNIKQELDAYAQKSAQTMLGGSQGAWSG